MNPATLKNSA